MKLNLLLIKSHEEQPQAKANKTDGLNPKKKEVSVQNNRKKKTQLKHL